MSLDPYAHCHFCGAAYAQPTWPRTCAACGQMTFRNPTPVAVALVPVTFHSDHSFDAPDIPGLLLVNRTLAPAGPALPGGFVDYEDASWQAAAEREVDEEAGLTVVCRGDAYATAMAPNKTLLLFGVCDPIDISEVRQARSSNETSGVSVLRHGQLDQTGIVFDLHAKVAADWLAAQLPGGIDYYLGADGQPEYYHPM